MDPADQKLYTGSSCSWLITRSNQIKRACQIDFLFCSATDDTYETYDIHELPPLK